MKNTADPARLGYVGSTERKSNEWFTPIKYIESAHTVLGRIELDPFSSASANKIVGAERFFTEKDDAFQQDWSARSVFMNPPYSGKLVAASTNKFMDEFASGSFQQGIFLVNNATETKWFQRGLREASAVCFTDHRIKFWAADDKQNSNSNTRGQAFFYFTTTDSTASFVEEFSAHGKVVTL